MGGRVWEIFTDVIPMVLSFFALLFSFSANRKANNLTREDIDLSIKEKQEAKRPKLTLEAVTLDPNKVEIYVGSNIDIKDERVKPIIGEKYDYAKEIVLNPAYFRKNVMLNHNQKDYLFVNQCYPDTHDIKNLVLAFGMLNLKIDFGNVKISELKAERAYSMLQEDRCFGNDIELELKAKDIESPLEISLAFAYIDALDTTTPRLYNILGLEREEKLDFFKNREIASKYLNFTEIAYLFSCKTTSSSIPYEYTLILQIDKNGKLVSGLIHDGDEVFYKEANKATQEVGISVICKSIL